MTDASDEARRALVDIEHAQKKSQAFREYSKAWPAVLAWGFVWLGANTVTQFYPAYTGWAWGVGIALGTLASAASGVGPRSSVGGPGRFGRFALLSLVFAACITSLCAVLDLDERQQVNALISLLVATGYMIFGVFRGVRMLAAGLMIGAAVLVGFFAFHDWFDLWMAVAGGGLLILTALWLRTA